MPKKNGKTEDPHVKAAIDARKKAQRDTAMARIPEFARLDLSSNIDKNFATLAAISSGANEAIATTASEISRQAVILSGRVFMHLRSILPHGDFQMEIESKGYEYTYVKRAMKVTDAFIDFATSGKKGAGALFDGGQLLSMANVFRRGELKSLASGDDVLGLDIEGVSRMSRDQLREHVKAFRAKASTAEAESAKKDDQLKKSHSKIRDLENDAKEARDLADLLESGPKDLADVIELCAKARKHVIASIGVLRTALSMGDVPDAHNLIGETLAFLAAYIRRDYDEFEGVGTDDEMIKTIEKNYEG